MRENKKNRAVAYRLLLIEAATISVCGLLFFVLLGPESAWSVILGGIAFIVPNLLFVRLSLGPVRGSGRGVLLWFYIGEALKIIATIIIFALGLLLVAPLSPALMFMAYALALLINLFGLAVLMNE